MRHGTCFRRRLSTHHAGAAPHSAVAELGVVRRLTRVIAYIDVRPFAGILLLLLIPIIGIVCRMLRRRWWRPWTWVLTYAILGSAFAYLGYGPQVDERRFDSHEARWETITTDKETFGHAPFRLVALDSTAAIELASNEIYAHLKTKPESTVTLTIERRFDYGKFRGWSVYSVDGLRDNFHMLTGSIKE